MPDDVSHDLIVLIPGILGSRLTRGDQSVWGIGHAAANIWRLTKKLTADLAFAEDAFDPASLIAGVDDGVRADGLLHGPAVLPGVWRTGSYAGLTTWLESAFPERVASFPYDWRQSNRVSARRLADAIAPAIRKRRSTWPAARVQFVCHSMGGLVARYFAEVLDTEHDTRRVITIGTPYLGAVKALPVLADGYVRFGPKVLALGELARSLPSVAELLPMYRCYGPNPGSLVTLSESPDSFPDLPSATLGHALGFHAELQAATARNGQDGPSYHPLIGHLQPTDWWASTGQDAKVAVHRFEGFDRRGDGTVARVSASPPEWRDDSCASFFAGKHASFQETSEVWTQLHGILTSQPKRVWMSTGDELALDAPEWIEPGQRWEVLVESKEANERLQLEVAVVDDDGIEVESATPRWDSEHGRYRATVTVAETGTFRVEVRCRNFADVISPVSDVLLSASSDGHDEDPDA